MCEHLEFTVGATVHRLTDEAGTVTGYTADVRIMCGKCFQPFMFLGLPPGVAADAPRVSIDAQEARMPICPADERPSPLTRLIEATAPERKN